MALANHQDGSLIQGRTEAMQTWCRNQRLHNIKNGRQSFEIRSRGSLDRKYDKHRAQGIKVGGFIVSQGTSMKRCGVQEDEGMPSVVVISVNPSQIWGRGTAPGS